MIQGPNLREDDATQQEGVMLQTDAVALNLSDDDVARAIGNRINFAKSWWNKQENLETVQKRAENVWLNLVSDDIDLYDYQEPYQENRIFVAIESLISQAVGRPPQPMVTESYDSDASRDLARNIEKVLLTLYHDLYQKHQLEMVARHLLTGFRYGVIKYRWDTGVGRIGKNGKRKGGIVTEVVRPDKILFDAGATDKDNIPLIAERQEASSDFLCNRFPDKQTQIMQEVGRQYGTKTELTDLTAYHEVHFTGWLPDSGQEYEGVAWKLNNVVLDKMRSPNYNYDETKTNDQGELIYTNFFDRPKKPYVVFNYLNQGRYIVDSTSLTEQTMQLQRQLEKRGRQIDENADMANAGTIYNSLMVTEENVAKLIGDPDEKIMAKGDVTKAAMRLPVNTLEQYVIQDKFDLRGAIDTLFGANAPLQGEKSGNPTLGQDELSVQRNTSRLGTIATMLENGMDRLYKAEVQLMKVFFTEPDEVKYTGPDGHAEFIDFSNESIETGLKLRVREGSLLPDDPATQLQVAEKFFQVFDPLTVAEYLQFDDPKKHAKMMFEFKANAAKYGEEYLGIKVEGNHDPDAVNAIQQISQGQQPQVPDSPSSNYVAQMQTHMASPAFGQMTPPAQEQLRQHAQAVVQQAKKKLGLKEVPQLPVKKKPGILGRFAEEAKKTLFQ